MTPACYNADFDGDQMNLLIASSLATRNEISELSSVSNWFISHTTSSPSMGQVDDSIIGTAELTRSNVKFDKYHAMLLCQNTSILPSFDEMTVDTNSPTDYISGRDAVSKLLADTPINFTRTPTWYEPNMAPYIKYDPSEIKVKIDQGKLLTGILDKKSIGKNASGGLYHVIEREYGADKSLEVMFNMQQMANSFILQYGYTIGIMDLMIPEASKREIDCKAADIINQSKIITEELHNGEIIPPIGKTVDEFYEDRQIETLRILDDFTDPIMRAIDPNTNNLFKLIQFGSKGKPDNMFNMISAVGQKLINGDRIKQKFGFKRTLPYFPRFDTSPESRGYITNSYLAGMTSSEYVFNAMAARFDLISKALSTSVTGEQNRKSIKNLESIIINNFRQSVKNDNIIQFVYGENFLDPRRVERVKFPTVMISDDEFKLYLHKDYPEFHAAMANDRSEYRRIFLNVEDMNVRELISDERRMPANVERIITDITRDNIDLLKEPSLPDTLKLMVECVDTVCTELPYVLMNNAQKVQRSAIPQHISDAAWLMTMLIRSYLHPNAMIKHQLTPEILKVIIDKICLRYTQALIEPGTAVGTISAQSFSEPLTQYMLDAHHRSASGGTSKSGMTNAREILGTKDVDKLSNPSMLIPVSPEYANNKAKVQEIANNIEMMKLKQFVVLWQVFFERYGAPVHSNYVSETKMITAFEKLNPLLTPPGDLTRWCLRIVLNKTTLILKNMALELIITRLRETFPDTYIVYTPENSPQIVIRVYFRNSMFKGTITTADIKEVKSQFMKTIIRGVSGITNTAVIKMVRNQINTDGSITRDDNRWGITTSGTNLRGILSCRFVDKYKVRTDAIQEIRPLLGVEAARQVIISELRNLVDSCNVCHYMIYADEMTYTGRVTSIEASGLKTREASNILLRIGFSAPLATMEEAAMNSAEDSVTGITAPLLVGSIPRYGTLYNQFHINREFVMKNVKKPDDVVEALFE